MHGGSTTKRGLAATPCAYLFLSSVDSEKNQWLKRLIVLLSMQSFYKWILIVGVSRPFWILKRTSGNKTTYRFAQYAKFLQVDFDCWCHFTRPFWVLKRTSAQYAEFLQVDFDCWCHATFLGSEKNQWLKRLIVLISIQSFLQVDFDCWCHATFFG